MRHNLGRVVATAALAAALAHHIRREGEGPLTTVMFPEDYRGGGQSPPP
jgi:hypothetical protein